MIENRLNVTFDMDCFATIDTRICPEYISKNPDFTSAGHQYAVDFFSVDLTKALKGRTPWAFPPRRRVKETLDKIRRYRLDLIVLVVESPVDRVEFVGEVLGMMIRDPVVVSSLSAHSEVVWRPPDKVVTTKNTVLIAFALSGVPSRVSAYRSKRRRRPSSRTWTKKGAPSMIVGSTDSSKDYRARSAVNWLRTAVRSERSLSGRQKMAE